MVDPVSAHRIGYRTLYVTVAFAVMFFAMLPLSTTPTALPGPDVVVALTVAWVLRRPDYMPAISIVFVFFMQDMLMMRPPGVWTLIMLLAAEFLRARVPLTRDLPFAVEWGMVALVMAAMFLANRLALALFMVPQSTMGATLIQLAFTILVYPLVVFLSHYALGLRKIAPGEVDALGHRI
jgi:rod shape-determining protein MreD